MEPLEAIELLARSARRETPPPTDVALKLDVLEGLRRRQTYLFPLAWSAGLSLAAAALAIALTLHSAGTTTDSMTTLFAPAQVQMP